MVTVATVVLYVMHLGDRVELHQRPVSGAHHVSQISLSQ